MSKGLQRFQKFALKHVLPHIGKPKHKFWISKTERLMEVKMSGQRLGLIKRTQHCAACLIEGDHFWLECSGCWAPHFNLYATNHHGHPVLMTMDHILPKSNGGVTLPENLQLLCCRCNGIKASKLLSIEGILQLRFKKDPKNLFEAVLAAYEKRHPELVKMVERAFEQRKAKPDRMPEPQTAEAIP